MYTNVGCIRDFLKQDLALEFCRNQNKHISILTEIYINHDQIHYIRNNWLDSFIFSPGDNHTEELSVMLHPGLKGVTEVDTDPKRRFAFFRLTRKLRARGHFFEELKSYMENANKENKNKIILGDFDCIMDKTDSYGGNKTQRIHTCCFNFTLSKLIILDNGSRIYEEWKTQIPLSSPTTIDSLAQNPE